MSFAWSGSVADIIIYFLGDPGESGRSYLQPNLGSLSDREGHVSETSCTCNQGKVKSQSAQPITFKE